VNKVLTIILIAIALTACLSQRNWELTHTPCPRCECDSWRHPEQNENLNEEETYDTNETVTL
jgi:hypothetical protein